jgi:hypothetical protein
MNHAFCGPIDGVHLAEDDFDFPKAPSGVSPTQWHLINETAGPALSKTAQGPGGSAAELDANPNYVRLRQWLAAGLEGLGGKDVAHLLDWYEQMPPGTSAGPVSMR